MPGPALLTQEPVRSTNPHDTSGTSLQSHNIFDAEPENAAASQLFGHRHLVIDISRVVDLRCQAPLSVAVTPDIDLPIGRQAAKQQHPPINRKSDAECLNAAVALCTLS